MRIMQRSALKRSNDSTRIIITTIMGIAFGFFIGISISSAHLTKISLLSGVKHSFDVPIAEIDRFSAEVARSHAIIDESSGTKHLEALGSIRLPKINVPSNPRGADSLPPGIVVSESDCADYGAILVKYMTKTVIYYDLKKKPKYLLTFTVGYDQRHNIDAAVKKFSDDFAILLFHYDGRTSEWDQFEWSKNAIHVSARKQTKWWYAKRFLHPDIVSAYEYIFIWDEDLGVEHFNGDKYINLVKKHGLEISQPGLEPNNGLTWEMTKRRGDREVHTVTEEKPGWCSDPHLPPCAAFVEIMAPVFSREAWRCVWHMIQNDLVHGWGLDFALRRCVEQPAHEKIGVIDSQWIVHQVIPSLGNQGEADNGKDPRDAVRTSVAQATVHKVLKWCSLHKFICCCSTDSCDGPSTPYIFSPVQSFCSFPFPPYLLWRLPPSCFSTSQSNTGSGASPNLCLLSRVIFLCLGLVCFLLPPPSRASALLLPVSPASAFAFGSCKQGWRCLGVDA